MPIVPAASHAVTSLLACTRDCLVETQPVLLNWLLQHACVMAGCRPRGGGGLRRRNPCREQTDPGSNTDEV